MHGLINRGIQRFVVETYGEETWEASLERAGIGFGDFEAMLSYDDAVTIRILAAVSDGLGRSREDLLEDIGTFLVTDPKVQSLRRLLRFGGVSFTDFLQSLDDLPDRARLAVSDLVLPRLELREEAPDRFSLRCYSETEGWGHVFVGVLRAMADDYGALVYLEHAGAVRGCETLQIALVETAFANGRAFELGLRPA